MRTSNVVLLEWYVVYSLLNSLRKFLRAKPARDLTRAEVGQSMTSADDPGHAHNLMDAVGRREHARLARTAEYPGE